jgi:hypothetical protein
LGVAVSTAWAFVALALGRNYEAISGARPVNPVVSAAE